MVLIDNLLHKSPVLENAVIAGGSHVGLVRESNEDCFLYVTRDDHCAMMVGVADGMGGHDFGEVASYMVMKYLLNDWNERKQCGFANKNEITEFIKTSIRRANDNLFHVNRELKIKWCMGTTLSMGIMAGRTLVVAQIGDSRVYRHRKNKFKALTVDQSWREEMVASGIMSMEEASSHPLSNMLTNCVGAVNDLRIEFTYFTVNPGDRFIFCSDGLTSMVSDERIGKTVQEAKHPRECVDDLIKYALRGGGSDNVTVVALYV